MELSRRTWRRRKSLLRIYTVNFNWRNRPARRRYHLADLKSMRSLPSSETLLVTTRQSTATVQTTTSLRSRSHSSPSSTHGNQPT
uniref:Uncharacterized protein n=1 Tax=Arundo donax TaxID=35708 RepID=A0A0A9DR37_ARUDO